MRGRWSILIGCHESARYRSLDALIFYFGQYAFVVPCAGFVRAGGLREAEKANTPFLAALPGALRRCSSLVWLATLRSKRLALHPASAPKNGTLAFSASLISSSSSVNMGSSKAGALVFRKRQGNTFLIFQCLPRLFPGMFFGLALAVNAR